MPAYPLLLRLLLLAVFFHTAIGMPLHEARHLRGLVAEVAQAEGDALRASPDTAPDSHGEEAHGLCAWCHAYTQADDGMLPDCGQAVAASAGSSGVAPHTAVASAHPGHWRFASRDPPRGAGAAFG